MKTYAERTYDSKNFLVRFAHRKRFNNSLKSINFSETKRILDYGCGDGKFLNSLFEITKGKEIYLVGFEPVQIIKNNVNFTIYNDLNEIKKIAGNKKFNIITCFEVLEHFNEKKQTEILEQIYTLLQKDGQLIISVPIETGIPALIKNVFRKFNYPKAENYKFKNIFKSFLGLPLEEFRKSDTYLSHTGFDYRKLEHLLKKQFILVNKKFSPVNIFGRVINSQVFFTLKKI